MSGLGPETQTLSYAQKTHFRGFTVLCLLLRSDQLHTLLPSFQDIDRINLVRSSLGH